MPRNLDLHAVSHLFFVDDLMLFSKVSEAKATILKDCLDDFCNLSESC